MCIHVYNQCNNFLFFIDHSIVLGAGKINSFLSFYLFAIVVAIAIAIVVVAVVVVVVVVVVAAVAVVAVAVCLSVCYGWTGPTVCYYIFFLLSSISIYF